MRKVLLMLRQIACATALLMATGLAHATVIDFEEVPDTADIQTSLSTQGYLFTSEHFHTPGSSNTYSPFVWNGTNYIGYESGRGHPLAMSRADGGSFSLYSLDVAEFYSAPNSDRPNADLIEIWGLGAGGQTMVHQFTLDGVYDGRNGAIDFQHFVLPSIFSDLSSVVFTGLRWGGADGGISLDNIEVVPTSVPEPGTLALFGLGLLAAGAARRRRAAIPAT